MDASIMENTLQDNILPNLIEIIEKNKQLQLDKSKDNSFWGIIKYRHIVVNSLIEICNNKNYIVTKAELQSKINTNIAKELSKIEKGKKKTIINTNNKYWKAKTNEIIEGIASPRRNQHFLIHTLNDGEYIINQPKIANFVQSTPDKNKAKKEYITLRRPTSNDEKELMKHITSYNNYNTEIILKEDLLFAKIIIAFLSTITVLMFFLSESKSSNFFTIILIGFIALAAKFYYDTTVSLKH